MPAAISLHKVDDLALDAENPRLPESIHGKSQSEILRYLYENATLEELAQSFLDNGFFAHEPLIVLKPAVNGKHVVLEGNRRFATLLILRNAPEAEGLRFDGIEIAPNQLDKLNEVPCFPIDTRDEVHRYLGFRHIGGIKAWAPEAKARYLQSEIDRASQDGIPDVFREVGRRVGSNAQGVRNPYIAIKILQFARAEFGSDVNYVQRERFGVWLRCMNSKDIRTYIGFGDPKTQSEVTDALRGIDQARLNEVLSDLSLQGGQRRALLGDSREVTDYGRILVDSRAHAALRKHQDISVARQVIDELAVAQRVRRVIETCRVILEEVQLAEEIDSELADATRDLEKVVESLNATVYGRLQKVARK